MIEVWERQVKAWSKAHEDWKPFHPPYFYIPKMEVAYEQRRNTLNLCQYRA